jgi:hypothetical protein
LVTYCRTFTFGQEKDFQAQTTNECILNQNYDESKEGERAGECRKNDQTKVS